MHATQEIKITLNIFFYACDKIKPIWKIIESEIKARTNKTVQINEQIALLGYHKPNASAEEKRKISHLLAISKLCISKFRYGVRYKIELILEKELQLRNHFIK